MDSVQRVTILEHLQARSAVITETWYQAVLSIGFSPDTSPLFHQELRTLTDNFITVLLTEPFAPALGELIGAALAERGFQTHESMRVTLTALPEAILAALDDDHEFLLPRIVALQAAVATGLFAAVRQQAHTAHERNHAALAEAWVAAQTRCQRMEEQLRAITLHVPLVLFTTDQHGVITFAAGRGLEALNMSSAHLVGRSIAEIASQQPAFATTLDAVLRGEAVTMLVQTNARTFETRYMPLLDDAGVVTEIIGVSLDVTEQPRKCSNDPGFGLTPEDQALLTLLAEGRTNWDIGQTFGLGTKAIEKRLAKLFAKLNVHTRTEAVALAFRGRLI